MARGTHTEQRTIVKWPRLFILHLNRWQYDEQEKFARIRIDDNVVFKKSLKPCKEVTYKLRSIIVHRGPQGLARHVSSKGHYVSFVYDDKYGWILYNDSSNPAPHIHWDLVQQQKPYLLLYEQVEGGLTI